MAGRTVSRFNEAAEKDGRGTVVTWCPSCHMHMSDIMAPGNAARFDIAHITELLADRADRLAPLLKVPVRRRVLLHRHMGFATHVAVNDRVAGVLSRIEGLVLIEGRRIRDICAARSPRCLAPWTRPRARPGPPPSQTTPIRSARSFIPAIANWRCSTAGTTLALRIGSS